MHPYLHPQTTTSLNRVYMTQPSDNQKDRIQEVTIRPSNQFAPLESVFRRRLLVGIGTASLVAVGADFAGVTSSLLGLLPDSARSLRLDVIYPIGGYSRCLDAIEGFEFIYPSNWVGDQTVLYRAARKLERSLDPPPLSNDDRRRKNVNEPVVAFGPPGSNGELNVSVIVSPVSIDFSIETFGGAKEVGEAIVQTITGSGKLPDVKGTLIQANVREDSSSRNLKYYTLEFKVESPAFRRHNVAVCCIKGGKLFTLNSQAPESIWPKVKTDFYRIADSFSLTS
ncbi:psbP domain-containing protein 7, chloroplastic [Nicotiana tabacum]|uniref:PsbP domain-containing protein 7, chloroplastic n=2 Tax=Nicotiana TaxID=4085 RepID=A0A1S3XZ97_TOBAC|nr:PREDICTED: psbP domain-containing protein 7, chloroplastic [Nicotiana sylvestris]XP_016445027.1 PREDICTED: psbP domain-containing protein 7, chloroplastic-like [Nicotiana tabacum]